MEYKHKLAYNDKLTARIKEYCKSKNYQYQRLYMCHSGSSSTTYKFIDPTRHSGLPLDVQGILSLVIEGFSPPPYDEWDIEEWDYLNTNNIKRENVLELVFNEDYTGIRVVETDFTEEFFTSPEFEPVWFEGEVYDMVKKWCEENNYDFELLLELQINYKQYMLEFYYPVPEYDDENLKDMNDKLRKSGKEDDIPFYTKLAYERRPEFKTPCLCVVRYKGKYYLYARSDISEAIHL